MSSNKSESSKRVMNMVYGIGASVVILGALFKLMHWPGGSVMLIAGLLTEAAIFFISAFEKPEKDLDWSLVYPQLREDGAEYYEGEYYEEDAEAQQLSPNEDLIAEKLEELFKAANIDSKLLEGLSGSIQKLTKTASSISNAIEVNSYTQAYAQEVSNATESIKMLNSFYQSQIEVSELQSQFNRQIVDTSSKVKDEMDSLSSNLSALNNVYGNMLTAMRG